MIKTLRSMLLELSDCRGHSLRPSLCKLVLIDVFYSEIESKKEDNIPKRVDFLTLKMFRKPGETNDFSATTTSKYNEPMADLSTTFKFAPGASNK
jgi:hypothetical protein